MQMTETARQAEASRREREQRKEFIKAQRERVRQHGVGLREQRFQTEDTIADAIEEKRKQAKAIGDAFRTQQEMLRYKRVVQDRAWATHGHELTEKYSTKDNQEKVRALKADLCEVKTKTATEMRNFLKQAKKTTDDDILEVNTDRARRVYTDTAHAVIRLSKQQQVAQRWDGADRVREVVSGWKAEKAANTADYVARARELAAVVNQTEEKVASQIRAKRIEDARRLAEQRREIRAERDLNAASVRDQKRSVRDAVAENQIVTEDEVCEVAGGKENFNLFSRFFDFRKKAASSLTPRAELSWNGSPRNGNVASI